jgi:hypothetical protein
MNGEMLTERGGKNGVQWATEVENLELNTMIFFWSDGR